MPGWKPLIVCNNPRVAEFKHECGFNDVIVLMQHVIHDLIILSTFLAVAVFIFIGFKLMTAGGNTSAMSEAKKSATSVAKGYIVILAAWVVVYTITSVLLRPEFNFLLEGIKQ